MLALAVAMIGGNLRSILRFGPSGAEVKGGSSTYRDAWCTIYASGFVHFSLEVSVDLELRYEKCYGICAASSFLFFAWSGGCHKFLLNSEISRPLMPSVLGSQMQQSTKDGSREQKVIDCGAGCDGS